MRSYADKLEHFKLGTLELRRTVSDLTFLYKLLNNKIDCLDLLSKININVPSRPPRHPRSVLYVPRYRTNLGKHSFMSRITHKYNKISGLTTDVDIFSNTLHKYKSLICTHFKGS